MKILARQARAEFKSSFVEAIPRLAVEDCPRNPAQRSVGRTVGAAKFAHNSTPVSEKIIVQRRNDETRAVVRVGGWMRHPAIPPSPPDGFPTVHLDSGLSFLNTSGVSFIVDYKGGTRGGVLISSWDCISDGERTP